MEKNAPADKLDDHVDSLEDRLAPVVAAYHEALLEGRSPSELSHQIESLDLDSRAELERAERVLVGLVKARERFGSQFASSHNDPPADGSGDAAETAESGSLPLKQLGRFKIERELGRGGLGICLPSVRPGVVAPRGPKESRDPRC